MSGRTDADAQAAVALALARVGERWNPWRCLGWTGPIQVLAGRRARDWSAALSDG